MPRSTPAQPSRTRSLPVRSVIGLLLALVLAALGGPASAEDDRDDNDDAAASEGGGEPSITALVEDGSAHFALGRAVAAPELPAAMVASVRAAVVTGYEEAVEAAQQSEAARAAAARSRRASEQRAAAPAMAAAPAGSIEEILARHFGSVAGQARAIAVCESNLNPGAVSRTNDHGLFQINAVHRGQFESVTGQPWSAVYDPEVNTRYAKWLYDQQGWRPWTCRKVL